LDGYKPIRSGFKRRGPPRGFTKRIRPEQIHTSLQRETPPRRKFSTTTDHFYNTEPFGAVYAFQKKVKFETGIESKCKEERMLVAGRPLNVKVREDARASAPTER